MRHSERVCRFLNKRKHWQKCKHLLHFAGVHAESLQTRAKDEASLLQTLAASSRQFSINAISHRPSEAGTYGNVFWLLFARPRFVGIMIEILWVVDLWKLISWGVKAQSSILKCKDTCRASFKLLVCTSILSCRETGLLQRSLSTEFLCFLKQGRQEGPLVQLLKMRNPYYCFQDW